MVLSGFCHDVERICRCDDFTTAALGRKPSNFFSRRLSQRWGCFPSCLKHHFLGLIVINYFSPQIINKTIWETHHFQISLLGKQWVSISMLRDYVIYTTPWENYSFSQSFMVKSSCLLFLATFFFLAKTSQFVRRAFHHIGIGVLRICCGHLKLRCNSWHFEKGQNHDFSPAKFEIDPSFMAILLGKIMLHR